MSDKPLIPEGFMREMARDVLIRELSSIISPGLGISEDDRRRATEIVDKIEAKGKLFEFLESTMPEPCPTCGHLPGW